MNSSLNPFHPFSPPFSFPLIHSLTSHPYSFLSQIMRSFGTMRVSWNTLTPSSHTLILQETSLRHARGDWTEDPQGTLSSHTFGVLSLPLSSLSLSLSSLPPSLSHTLIPLLISLPLSTTFPPPLNSPPLFSSPLFSPPPFSHPPFSPPPFS